MGLFLTVNWDKPVWVISGDPWYGWSSWTLKWFCLFFSNVYFVDWNVFFSYLQDIFRLYLGIQSGDELLLIYLNSQYNWFLKIIFFHLKKRRRKKQHKKYIQFFLLRTMYVHTYIKRIWTDNFYDSLCLRGDGNFVYFRFIFSKKIPLYLWDFLLPKISRNIYLYRRIGCYREDLKKKS